MRTYFPIVFMQGDEAAEVLPILEHQGTLAAIDFLSQWDFGHESEHRPEPAPWGACDRLFRSGPYILSYNLRLGYVALCRVADSTPTAGPAPSSREMPQAISPGPRWSAQLVTLDPATT
jgi:hypothetical protein